MAKIVRETAQIFGSNAGFHQIAQFGSLQAGSPNFSTNLTTIQALSNWLVGWFNAVEGLNSPAIEDMNAYCYVMAYQVAYILQQGVPEWDQFTPYYSGSIVNNAVFVFVVSSANATVGATYSNNSQIFTVQNTITGGLSLTCTGTGAPTASGTLTKLTGTGDSTITFSSTYVTTGLYISIADNNSGNPITNTTYWQPVVPTLGSIFQRLQVNAAGTATEYSYNTINSQTATGSLTVPAGYNLTTGYLTVPSGDTYTIAGSMQCGGYLQATGTGVVQATGSGIVRGF